MYRSDALEQLCSHCGIETAYKDCRGRQHEVSVETQIALLHAMDIEISEPGEAAIVLDSLLDNAWRMLAPAVQVIFEGGSICLPLKLPTAAVGSALSWHLTLESGETATGRFMPRELRCTKTRKLDGGIVECRMLELHAPSELGYHNLQLIDAEQKVVADISIIVCPNRCYEPASLADGKRWWGPSVQLYALRSRRNWGIGDFGDLRRLVDFAANGRAAMIGLNPLHALFTEYPEKTSPYSPSQRTAFNAIYLDVEAVADYAECEAARRYVQTDDFQSLLQILRDDPLVEYADVLKAKHTVLKMLYQSFCERHLAIDSARAREFRTYIEDNGDNLQRYALFECLHHHLKEADSEREGWQGWPKPYRDPHAPAVKSFAHDHAVEIDYFLYLQWQIGVQLSAITASIRQAGMPLGLYLDLAISVDAWGAEIWSHPSCYAHTAHVGAPPDDFNPGGQDWGLPPLIPQRLATTGYASHIAALRVNMRYAGALRIDHVMGLMRLFWVPVGMPAEKGAYIRYPLEDLIGIVALESHRNRCVVIGEDLGTVANEMRIAMREHGLYSYRLLYFERDADAFKAPEEYPPCALVAVATHDLPTLRGFWLGSDLSARENLHLFPSDEVRAQMVLQRASDRVHLPLALEKAGLLPAGAAVTAAALSQVDADFVQAVHAFIARAPSRLMAVQMEDLTAQVEQANLPSTTEAQNPNWRRKLPLYLEQWSGDADVLKVTTLLRDLRGYQPQPPAKQPPLPAITAGVASLNCPSPPAIPRATYRLQFNRDFTFRHACELVPYFASLGISHIYASPYLKARPGSTHGYDIIDHNAFNPEIGDADDFEQLARLLRQHGMGQMLDIVPNHMGVLGGDNRWWLDVLENGRASRYASYFDIEWEPLSEELQGKVLTPVLGHQYGDVLERGEITLKFDSDAGEFSLHYFQHCFPIDPRDYPSILQPCIAELAAQLGAHTAPVAELQSVISAFGHLPRRDEQDANSVTERARDKEMHKQRLAQLCRQTPEIALVIQTGLGAFDARMPEGQNQLHELIKSQAYRLAYWRTAADDINYRRFFDINDLAALRMENETVFADTHRLILKLIAERKVHALRIDHPDGLCDPAAYFERLQRAAPRSAENEADGRPLYLLVEKILADGERLPADWAIHGATGYHFLNVVNRLFVDAKSETRMTRVYAAFIGERLDYPAVLRNAKLFIMVNALASELNVLASKLTRIAKADRHSCDFTLNSLRRGLLGIAMNFPIYRTYITHAGLSDDDRRYITLAVNSAKRRGRGVETSAFEFIGDILTSALGANNPRATQLLEFTQRFQQFTSPVTAKATEDTAFYIYNRLTSLNEVGGNPEHYAISPTAFHKFCRQRVTQWPHTLNAGSTHDTKRSEDVRARINVLSEIPAEWRLALRQWSRINRHHKLKRDDVVMPSPNDEYLLYQTLIGSWPLDEMHGSPSTHYRDRISAFMLKAAREAKLDTSWTTPSAEYEQALGRFIGTILSEKAFLEAFLPLCRKIAQYGMLNSLSQLLLRLTAPGVPDIYQGCELWDFSLVDPDNRRPIDYEPRIALLRKMEACFNTDAQTMIGDLLSDMNDGQIKLYVLWRTLALRRDMSALFERGDYVPLSSNGAAAQHICAYLRRHADFACVVVAPRLMHRLTRGNSLPLGAAWGDTAVKLPIGQWRELFTAKVIKVTGESTRLNTLLSDFPLALLKFESK